MPGILYDFFIEKNSIKLGLCVTDGIFLKLIPPYADGATARSIARTEKQLIIKTWINTIRLRDKARLLRQA
jgi:hypothetical protein